MELDSLLSRVDSADIAIVRVCFAEDYKIDVVNIPGDILAQLQISIHERKLESRPCVDELDSLREMEYE